MTEEHVRPSGVLPSAEVDARLRAAMEALADDRVALPGLAAQVGLSPQRLRALARRQLGVPLARWRIWLRLARAADALGEGCTLAEAAVAGGFADQAHFTRQMREMTGLTPSQVLPVLRASGPGRRPPGLSGSRPAGARLTGSRSAYARWAT
ncbi:helix-turn-helix domain-containing protein [Kitasatospora sp. NPDC059827]|uniref:helix-turn-helix domain-containing protein n=1 Tax=Kitasatospora sp. NPDC059827 TaxID=3346964 RepID=UPI003650AB6A